MPTIVVPYSTPNTISNGTQNPLPSVEMTNLWKYLPQELVTYSSVTNSGNTNFALNVVKTPVSIKEAPGQETYGVYKKGFSTYKVDPPNNA